MIKILFVCHGNICRSPMAQYVMDDLVRREGLSAHFCNESAATSSEEIGNGVHHGTREKLRQVGIPCGNHRAVQLKQSDYGRFDFLLGMDSWNIRNMLRILKSDPQKKVHRLLDFGKNPRDIEDPWYTEDFDAAYDDILEGCQCLLEFIKRNGF